MIDTEFWPDVLWELNPKTNEIVWEWKSYHHFVQDSNPELPNYGVVSDHPELIHTNYTATRRRKVNADFMHTNAIDYNPLTDQIMLSVHSFSEIWVLDHSTTTEEAASHEGGNYGRGGDILYRYGNPQTYNQGNKQDRTLFGQHDAHWIPEGYPGAGNILIFNNGALRVREYSTIDEIKLGENNDAELVWRYQKPDFYATNISGAQRLPNGNTLICNGPAGQIFEVTPELDTVWELQTDEVQNAKIFNAHKYFIPIE